MVRVPKKIVLISHLPILSSTVLNDVKLCFGTGKRLNISASVLDSSLVRMLLSLYKHDDEKFVEFLLIRRPHVFQQKIRKSAFLSSALQKGGDTSCYLFYQFLLVLLLSDGFGH